MTKKSTTNRFVLAKNYLEETYDIRRNIVTHEFEFKQKSEQNYRPINENSIYIQMQMDNVNISNSNLYSLLRSDYIPEYNPFEDYFNNLPEWDRKTDYILQLAHYVLVPNADRDRFDNHFKKWLIRVIKCSIIDGYFNKQAFILVQEQQNSGKSTFCRFLCPPVLSDYIAENLSIDKDSRILMTSNLLINLDELSTLSKLEINALKSMFSKDKINDRLPYDRKNTILPRRASFIGSTNQSEFLTDETGSVRWLCFNVVEIDWNYKKDINIDMVYSQAYGLFKDGFKAEITVDEIKENEESNREFQLMSIEKELILKYFIPSKKNEKDTKFMTSTEIMIYIHQNTKETFNLNPVGIGKALKSLGFERKKSRENSIVGYWVYERYEINNIL